MFIEEIEAKKDSLGDKFECFGKKLDNLVDEAYEILADKKMSDKERGEFADIVAAIKGVKKASYELMTRYSDIAKETREKIDRKADEFANGLIKREA
jgi:hypothetical protein